MKTVVDTVIRPTQRSVQFRRPLGDGYYVREFHVTRRVDFRRFFVPHVYKVTQIRLSTNGVIILIDEWNDLLKNVIPTIHECYLEFANAKRCSSSSLFSTRLEAHD